MNTTKTVLILIAASAFTLTAAEPFLSPRASNARHAVIASTGVNDPSLLAEYPSPGSRTKEAAPSKVFNGVKDPNLLNSVSSCPMAPKTKDTAACAKHCEMSKK